MRSARCQDWFRGRWVGSRARRVLVVLALALSLPGATVLSGPPDGLSGLDRMADLPRTVLWAWERPESLGFLDPRESGVAFLASTLLLQGERVLVRPRLQPLDVPDRMALLAVVRIEADRTQPPSLSDDQRGEVVSKITEAVDSRVAALQVDFDATVSQRAFYRGLLFDLRRTLPASVRLSMTALASWCLRDDWLSDLPVDEAVPMLFRMGVDHRWVHRYLSSGGDFRAALCRHSVGISTDEPPPRIPAGRRIYVFHPEAWSQTVAHQTITELRRWQ